jgi:N-acetylglucosamine-6-phosphate deacetylase
VENLIIKNGIIITPFKKLCGRILFIKNGKIEKIINNIEFEGYPKNCLREYKQINVNGDYVSPGFIDIHTHGANGVDLVKDYVGPMAEFKIRSGTTGFLATLWTGEFSQMIKACQRIADYIKNQSCGSKVLGINLEGPYLNPNLGVQRRDLVKTPVNEDYVRLIEAGNGNIKIMTVAPELDGAIGMIKYLRTNDIVVSLGHSDIKLEKLDEAINSGIGLVTHLFNALGDSIVKDKGVKPVGIQEKLLIYDNLMCELIADKDGVHVNPILIKIILKCKGIQNIVLITDSVSMTGYPPGIYVLQDGRKSALKEGEDTVRILGNNDLCGSVMTMNLAVKNFIKHTGVNIEQAVQMATFNPSKVINLSHKKGEIKEGMDADITVFDEDFKIKLTIVEGLIRYDNQLNF